MKYLNKTFLVPAPLYHDWWNDPPPQISKGEWVKVSEGRERYVPEGRPLPRETT